MQKAQFYAVQSSYGKWGTPVGTARRQEMTALIWVAELRDEPECYAAIQCKFRETRGGIAKGKVDSFLAASGRPEFRRRIWMDRHHGAGLVCLVPGEDFSTTHLEPEVW